MKEEEKEEIDGSALSERRSRSTRVSSYTGFRCGLQHTNSCQYSYPLNKKVAQDLTDGEFIDAIRLSDFENQLGLLALQ